MPKNLQLNINTKLICIIDIGSNSIRTNVYLIDDNKYCIIFKDKYICNFAKGLTKSKNLSNSVIEKALVYLVELDKKLKCFRLFMRIAVATSALRLAKNAQDFTSVAEKILSAKIEIISGEREAILGVKGVELEVGKLSGLVLDLGGGSLELSNVKNSKIQSLSSLELGHQVLCDMAEGGINKLRNYIKKNLNTLSWLNKAKFKSIYLSGGKFRRLAKLHMRLTQGIIKDVTCYALNKKELKELIVIKEKNLKTKPEALLMYYTAVLLDELLQIIESDNFIFCGNSIREGLLIECQSSP